MSIHSHKFRSEILVLKCAYYLLLKYALLSNKKYALSRLPRKAVGKEVIMAGKQIAA